MLRLKVCSFKVAFFCKMSTFENITIKPYEDLTKHELSQNINMNAKSFSFKHQESSIKFSGYGSGSGNPDISFYILFKM